MLKRKVVLSFKPEVTIRVENGKKLTFENTTPLKTTRTTEFNLDEPFEVDLMGITDKQTHINSFSGNVLTTKDVGSGKVVATRTFSADGFSMKMFGPNDVIAIRHFKRVQLKCILENENVLTEKCNVVAMFVQINLEMK